MVKEKNIFIRRAGFAVGLFACSFFLQKKATASIPRAFLTHILFFILALFFTASNGFAQNSVSGKTEFFSGMLLMQHINQNSPFWFTNGNAKITLDSNIKDTVKASIAAEYAIVNINPNTLAVSMYQEFKLERAYIKARLPWIHENYVRLSAGKMPLSWGFGLYFNAGDILFGALPSAATGFDTNSYRVSTAWIADLQIPFTESFFAEFTAVPPLSNVALSNQNTGISIISPANNQGAFGARFVFEPFLYALQEMQAGYLAVDYAQKHRFYIALDGSIGADYNVSASWELDTKKDTAESLKTAGISASLFYTFNIQGDSRDYPLTVRGEVLFYPAGEKLFGFGMVSFGFTETVSASVTYLTSIPEKLYSAPNINHTVSGAFIWTPIKKLQLVVQSTINPTNPQALSTVTAGCVYTF